LVGLGVFAGSAVAVGSSVGTGVFVGWEVFVGLGVFVGSGLPSPLGVAVGSDPVVPKVAVGVAEAVPVGVKKGVQVRDGEDVSVAEGEDVGVNTSVSWTMLSVGVNREPSSVAVLTGTPISDKTSCTEVTPICVT